LDVVNFIIIIIIQTAIWLGFVNLVIEIKTIRQDKLTRMEELYVRLKEKSGRS
jgi:hypothetical protein